MNTKTLFVAVATGLCLGFSASFAVLLQEVRPQNAELVCYHDERRDSYKHFAFGEITYCRSLSQP